MLYTIENERVRASFTSLGGELTSIYGKATACEYLWQGDAASWEGQSPVLFPICGRLLDGYYTYAGEKYEMPLHGFARKMEMAVEEKTDTSITFRLSDDEETRKMYPFSFIYRVRYSLAGDTLEVAYSVENTDEKTLIFAFGAHPGFNVPLGDDKGTDYKLVFDASIDTPRQVLFKNNFTDREDAPYSLTDHTIAYSNELFDAGSLFFTEMGDHVTLKSDVSGRFVRLDFKGFPVLGFWHAEGSGAPFLCIEPWESVPTYFDAHDDLETKAMMNHLPKGGYYKKSYFITVG
ncbi:MAG: aldose 1-epimerase family protein [Ruminococcaceae bacterium]|nr:aldose 1-epimerase family protein [Oscillospiraceae bacterium]